jgi:hypothetical protein
MHKIHNGYAERQDGYGVSFIELHLTDEGKFYAVWENGDLRDDIDSIEEYLNNFSPALYETLKEYRYGISGGAIFFDVAEELSDD